MKLHAATAGAQNAITAYGDGYVVVAGQRHEASVIVTADQVVAWGVQGFDWLSQESFSLVKEMKAEIVLLGTGPTQRFPHPSLTSTVAGLEVMDVKAACRTYNILVAEGRKVAAALLLR